ncbi:MAG: hypothetical protein KAS77_09895, partial [Thermoplasmata archaeon]|nr:hypothetical protein [Thermoplasmata archaeon]
MQDHGRHGVAVTVCPIDYRYGSEQMRDIFGEEGKLRRMLLVEAALAESQAQVGMIPPEAAAAIFEAATSGRVTPQRVAEIEDEIRHDVMAVVKALA